MAVRKDMELRFLRNVRGFLGCKKSLLSLEFFFSFSNLKYRHVQLNCALMPDLNIQSFLFQYFFV